MGMFLFLRCKVLLVAGLGVGALLVTYSWVAVYLEKNTLRVLSGRPRLS